MPPGSTPLLRLPQGPTVRLRVSLLLREQMGTLESWRKAYGALKDTTTVRLAKVNSEFKVRSPPSYPNHNR
ncbi:hypothetical protein BHE74_00039986 [Ensete ventricosum]|nr:hypothetical protein BHE74_00039986 [Ensete ventricosum]